MTTLAAIDLFAGAGGLSAGLLGAGFRVLGAVESWPLAVESYRRNFRHPVLQTDVASVTAKALRQALGFDSDAIDLVAGGPPCQGFSIQRIGNDDDERNDLIFEFARVVSELRPRMFLMENVPGLLGKRGRHLVSRFETRLARAGYTVVSTCLNAADFGIPQIRRRIFFVGTREDLSPFEFPAATHTPMKYRTAMDAIGDLPPPPPDFNPLPGDPLHREMRLSKRNLERLKLIPPGGGFESLPVELRVDCHKAGAAKIGHRNVYGRLDPHAPAVTITARFDSFTRGKFAHPFQHRNITLREGARLQTFEDSFSFAGNQEEVAAQIGNAIPPLFARALGMKIRAHLAEAVAKKKPRRTPPARIRRTQLDLLAELP